ncbi:MAG: DUF2752 domain-containing protein [Kiritimatiellae bacterium]|nr:DUF2752 domain-containing protein [Kiritimatiellia bacterium]
MRKIICTEKNARLSLLILAVCLVHPPHGLGIPVCLFHRLTGLPCPGCGLTRSISSILHGRFGLAFQYHPFGFLFIALLALGAAYTLLRAPARVRIERWVDRRNRPLLYAYRITLALFLVFGFVRMGVTAYNRFAHAEPERTAGLARLP